MFKLSNIYLDLARPAELCRSEKNYIRENLFCVYVSMSDCHVCRYVVTFKNSVYCMFQFKVFHS